MAHPVTYLFDAMLPGLVLYSGSRIAGAITPWRPSWPRRRPAPALTTRRPIEQVAADLRRLGVKVFSYDGQNVRTSAVKQLTVQQLYDERLAEACAALGVPHSLALCSGTERTRERRRVRLALMDAGLVLSE